MTGTRVVRLVGAATLLAVLVGVLVAWRAAPFGPTLETGRVQLLEAPAYGTTYEVMLPTGRLELVVGPRTSALPGPYVDGSSGTDDVQAARGDSLVPVSWRLAPGTGTVPVDAAQPFELTVVAGGERYDLGAEKRGEGDETEGAILSRDLVVAVEGDADPGDLTVEVTYDGQTQTVDVESGEIEAGAAAGLYEKGSFATADRCGQRAAPGSGLTPTFVSCEVGLVTLTPYRPGLGWVDDADEAWAEVRVSLGLVNLERVSAGGGIDLRVVPDGTVQRVLLDGAEAEDGELAPSAVEYGGAEGELVFRVSEDPSVVTIERDLRLAEGYAKDAPTRRLRLTQDLTLEPA